MSGRSIHDIRIRLAEWRVHAFSKQELYDDLKTVLACHDLERQHAIQMDQEAAKLRGQISLLMIAFKELKEMIYELYNKTCKKD